MNGECRTGRILHPSVTKFSRTSASAQHSHFLRRCATAGYRSEWLSSIPPMRLDFLKNSIFRYEMKGLTSQIVDGSASIAVSDVNQAYSQPNGDDDGDSVTLLGNE